MKTRSCLLSLLHNDGQTIFISLMMVFILSSSDKENGVYVGSNPFSAYLQNESMSSCREEHTFWARTGLWKFCIWSIFWETFFFFPFAAAYCCCCCRCSSSSEFSWGWRISANLCLVLSFSESSIMGIFSLYPPCSIEKLYISVAVEILVRHAGNISLVCTCSKNMIKQ